MVVSAADRPVEDQFEKDLKDLPIPNSLVLPIYDENFHLSVLIGAALFWAGHKDVCQGQQKHPSTCLYNPDLPKSFFSRPKVEGLYISTIETPTDLEKPLIFKANYYEREIVVKLLPDRNIDLHTLEFHC